MPELATWNPERDVWETNQGDLISGHLAVFSETWPTSGSMRSGSVYALPTSAPATDDSGFSYLPTPNTHNWKESGNCRDFGADPTHALTCSGHHRYASSPPPPR